MTDEAEDLRLHAEAGDVGAMRRLGLLLKEQGESEEAESWLRKAAEAGDTQAMLPLGALMVTRGDATEAERWYRQAAEAGTLRRCTASACCCI